MRRRSIRVAICSAMAGGLLSGGQSAAVAPFVCLGTHKLASQQPVGEQVPFYGRELHALHPFKGSIFIGYGNAGDNTGPITVTRYTPPVTEPTGAPCSDKFLPVIEDFVAHTDEIDVYTSLNDRLILPFVDRRDVSSVHDLAIGRYVGGPPGWSAQSIPASDVVATPIHVFGAFVRPDRPSEYFLSGASATAAPDLIDGIDSPIDPVKKESIGTIWMTLDGGRTWRMITEPVIPGPRLTEPTKPIGFRCYGMGAIGQNVYVGCSSGYYLIKPGAKTLVPAGIDAVARDVAGMPSTATNIAHGANFDGRLVFLNVYGFRTKVRKEVPVFGHAFAFDGTTTQQIHAEPAHGLAVWGDALFLLGEQGKVFRRTDLDSGEFELIADGPDNSVSMTVLDGSIYLGTATSELWVAWAAGL